MTATRHFCVMSYWTDAHDWPDLATRTTLDAAAGVSDRSGVCRVPQAAHEVTCARATHDHSGKRRTSKKPMTGESPVTVIENPKCTWSLSHFVRSKSPILQAITYIEPPQHTVKVSGVAGLLVHKVIVPIPYLLHSCTLVHHGLKIETLSCSSVASVFTAHPAR